MAAVNAAVRDQFAARGVRVVSLDIAARSLRRSWVMRLSRLDRVIRAIIRLFGAILGGTRGPLYVGLSGGWGQIYEALLIGLARLGRLRVILHHHSFAYLESPMPATRLLVRLAGRRAVHVVLCEQMGTALRRCYPGAGEIRVVSNAAFVAMGMNASVRRERTSLSTIGFLGNITEEKGVLDFLAVADALDQADVGVTALLAGPFQDSVMEERCRAAIAHGSRVHYVGPVYGLSKDAFFDQIDALLFPTRYRNEAEPLTVLEAMARGVPVISYERGCLASMLFDGAGVLIQRGTSYVQLTVETLIRWRESPAEYSQASVSSRERFESLTTSGQRALAQLIELDITGPGGREPAGPAPGEASELR